MGFLQNRYDEPANKKQGGLKNEFRRKNQRTKKILADSSAKKWHILVIVYLLAIVVYITYFAVCHRILMIGFLIATLFMLFFELKIFIKERIHLAFFEVKKFILTAQTIVRYNKENDRSHG